MSKMYRAHSTQNEDGGQSWHVVPAEMKPGDLYYKNGNIAHCSRPGYAESDARMIAAALNSLNERRYAVDDCGFLEAGPLCPQCGHALTDGHCNHCEQRGI